MPEMQVGPEIQIVNTLKHSPIFAHAPRRECNKHRRIGLANNARIAVPILRLADTALMARSDPRRNLVTNGQRRPSR